MIKGTIVKRIIRGKERFYHQWRENGKTMSRYLRAEEILPLREKLEAASVQRVACNVQRAGSDTRNAKHEARSTIFLIGRRLEELSAAVAKMKKRALLTQLTTTHQPLITISGAERTGKTVLLQQAIAALSPEDRARAAYLSCPVDFPAADFMRELSSLYERGFRRFHLDALERSSEVTNLLPTLVDIYVPLGCRFIVASRDTTMHEALTTNHHPLTSSPLSFADFVLITGKEKLEDYLDYLGLAEQVKALAPPVSPHFGAVARAEAIEKLTTSLAERMLKEVIIRKFSAQHDRDETEVFTLELSHGGIDIVLADPKELTCELYEVKFAAERSDKQLARLLSTRNLDQIEHRYGMITTREVFYLGRDAWQTSGIRYRNAAKFLLSN